MSLTRRIVTAVFMVLAIALQSSVMTRWNLPGAVPDLLLVMVAAFAMRQLPAHGAMLGFLSGLLMDVTPPAEGLIGLSAFTLTIVGYAAATFRADFNRSVFGPLLYCGAAGALVVLVHALLGGLLGDPTISVSRTPWLMLTSGVYCTLLATIVIPLVRALLVFLMPAPTAVLRR
jgi:rod shape-determining protein MreD